MNPISGDHDADLWARIEKLCERTSKLEADLREAIALAKGHANANDLKFEAMDRALELAAEVNQAHHAILNNEATRLQEFQRTTMPRETYEVQHKSLSDAVGELAAWRNVQQGRQAMTAVVIPALISFAIGILFIFIQHLEGK